MVTIKCLTKTIKNLPVRTYKYKQKRVIKYKVHYISNNIIGS